MTREFTEAEVESILERLDSGESLTHELARDYGCSPRDILVLWNERHQARRDA